MSASKETAAATEIKNKDPLRERGGRADIMAAHQFIRTPGSLKVLIICSLLTSTSLLLQLLFEQNFSYVTSNLFGSRRVRFACWRDSALRRAV